MIHRAFSISSNYFNFHSEIMFLQKFFHDNMYPLKLMNIFTRKYMDNKYNYIENAVTVSRDKLYLQLPYIGYNTTKLSTEIRELLLAFYPQITVNFYFRNSFTIGSFFKKHLSETDVMMRTSVVYLYQCDCCTQSYIGSSKLQMFMRCASHAGVSYRTNKPYNSV